jgi:hypothetical protein
MAGGMAEIKRWDRLFMYFLAASNLVSLMLLVLLVIARGVQDSVRDIALMVVGGLMARHGTSFDFMFGASRSSSTLQQDEKDSTDKRIPTAPEKEAQGDSRKE